jgi:hypothetical protein
MTDVAAPNERDPEIHEAFISIACAILCFRRLQSFERPSKSPHAARGRLRRRVELGVVIHTEARPARQSLPLCG